MGFLSRTGLGSALLLGALILLSPPAIAAPLRAGAARVDITPPVGLPLWGYAARRDEPSVGVRDKLYARALVLEVGRERLALVGLDLGRAPTRTSVQAIGKRLAAAGIAHFFLVASHTHNGPVIEVDTGPKQGPYVRDLEDKIVAAVTQAVKELRPARLGVAARKTELNRNRHLRRAGAPVDREIIVVRVEDPSAKVVAHLVNFAAHPTMIDSKSHDFSADYPGVLAQSVETELGGVCVFLQGASGDLSPNPTQAATSEAFGRELAALVLDMSRGLRCTVTEPSSLQTRERVFRFGKRFDLSNPLYYAAYVAIFYQELIDFYEREYRDGIRPRLTTALLDGRIGFVGVSGEFFCEHALELKRRAGLDHLLFLGYCNDYHQYFPTIQAVAQGGYGADAMVSPVEVGAGEQMMDQALIDLLTMRGKIRASELGK